MAMQRQEPGRDRGQPPRHRKRRSLRDCDVYIRTGVCVLGTTCLFNHPPQPMPYEPPLFQMLQKPSINKGVRRAYIMVMMNGSEFTLASASGSNEMDALGMDEDSKILELQEFLQDFFKANIATRRCIFKNLSTGDTHSHDTGSPYSLDPSSSSPEEYFSAFDVVQGSDCSTLDSSSELWSVIEDSRVHWSKLRSSNNSDGTEESSCEIINNDADGNGESNREIFESLRQLPRYQRWLNCGVAPGDISLGPKIAEGGQAEIFEAEIRFKREDLAAFAGVPGSVLKVFKKGFSLQDLKSQWPDGLLFGGQFSTLFQGSMVLKDDRFALLLSERDMDLRKLIDVTLDKDCSLFDHDGTPRLKELRAYKSKCARSECSTPVFSEKCAGGLMYRIALEMKYLHSVDIFHRDLKASNILCSSMKSFGDITICVADFESSIGVVGTAFWRAPEILKQLKERKREIHFTREADVYGFAMTCYEIWTGHIPFEEYEHYDYDHVLNGVRPILLAHIPSWVKDLIQRCWHQDPLERPSFSAIVKELESSLMIKGLQLVGNGIGDFVAHVATNLVFLERASEAWS